MRIVNKKIMGLNLRVSLKIATTVIARSSDVIRATKQSLLPRGLIAHPTKNEIALNKYQRLMTNHYFVIFSIPFIYGRRTGGIVIEPSAF